jgi:hypothetical protein
MTIKTKTMIDPLTNSPGYLAFTYNDSAFGFTQDEAKRRLVKRMSADAVIYDEDTHSVYYPQTKNQ